MLVDLVVAVLMVEMTSYTCRACQFPVYTQSSWPGAERRRDWRARGRSSRVAAASARVVVDGGTLSWNALDQENDASPSYVDHCLEEIKQGSGLYTLFSSFLVPFKGRQQILFCKGCKPRSQSYTLIHTYGGNTVSSGRGSLY